MDKYNKACTEVINILECLSEEEYLKIPEKLLETIKSNADQDYEYEIDEDNFENTEILEETKAILFNIYRDYLCSEEQKERIINYQNKERQKEELRKKEEYNTNVFDKKDLKNESKETEDKYLIEIEKENIFRKFINYFKKFFKIKK